MGEASSADVHGAAIRLFRAAAAAGSLDEAVERVREVAVDIPAEMTARVMVCLAVESVWRARPSRSRVELVQWLDRWLLELMWAES